MKTGHELIPRGGKMIEIDLRKLERGTREGWVTVKRGGKVFRRRQRLGQKEQSTAPDIIQPPNPMLMDSIEHAYDYNMDMSFFGDEPDGLTELNIETGEFTFRPRDYIDWSAGGEETHAEPVKFRIEGTDIVRLDDDFRITVPKSELDNIEGQFKMGIPALLSLIDDKWGRHGSTYKDFKHDSIKYEDNIKNLDTFVPEYEEEFEEGSGKYNKRMGLKSCSNLPPTTDRFVPIIWYGGDRDKTALVGEAVQEVFSGRYNENNVIQQQIPLMIEGAQKINERYGEDVIYRGETNIENAKDILSQLDEFGDAELADKLFSCTENEKLGKWYSTVHNQETARGMQSKTNVMLKIPRDKFKDNVILDHRLTGAAFTPEEEVTIVGNDITLTGDDVMVNAKTPKRKTKKWISFTQFKSEGGITEDLMKQMRHA